MSKSVCAIKVNGAPATVQILPLGRHVSADGNEFVLDEQGMAEIVGAFNSRKNQMVIDYEHQTLSGDIAPAAGWIKALYARGADGLWAEVEWTKRARQFLGGCEYRYLSPVFVKDMADMRVVGLLNAALTNQPAIDGMSPLGQEAVVKGPLARDDKDSTKEERMLLKELMEIVGLKEDGTKQEALAALKEMLGELRDLRGLMARVRDALGLKDDAPAPEVEGTLAALAQSALMAEELKEKLIAAEAALSGSEARELVEHAMKQGKVSPAQKDWAMDYAMRDAEAFRVFAAKAPVSVPLGGTLKVQPAMGGARGLCALQAEVNKALGLSENRFRKFSKKEEA